MTRDGACSLRRRHRSVVPLRESGAEARRMPGRTLVGAAAAAGLALLAFGELQAWLASRADYPRPTERREGPAKRREGPAERSSGPEDGPGGGPGTGEDVVLVLGYPARRDGSPGFLQRWRTRIARRSAPPGALFVFTGGAVHGDVPEAVTMAQYARRLGIRSDRIALETRATSTRENLSLSLPWLADARTIRIASNTAHARRARRYLRDLDPVLFARLRPTSDFRVLELGPLRLALTFYDFVAGRVAARRPWVRESTAHRRENGV